MKYALIDQFDIPLKGKNLGDYIQTIAAMQFLPSDATFIDRERLDEYKGDEVKLIMASWFMLKPKHWPPTQNIHPLFISSHFTERSLNIICESPKGCEYFKKYEPIGCRDTMTAKRLMKEGIDAYFSGCLTLTLGNTYKRTNIDEEILFVDVMYNYRTFAEVVSDLFLDTRTFLSKLYHGGMKEPFFILRNLNKRKKLLRELFSDDILSSATCISQMVRLSKNDDHFTITDNYLRRLAKARFVVTSRIHCALPCLAIGTPVIFIDSELDTERLSGLKDLFNTITIKNDGRIFSNFDYSGKLKKNDIPVNKNDYLSYKHELEEKCQKFAAQ